MQKAHGCAVQNATKPAAQTPAKKLFFCVAIAVLLTATTPLFAQNPFLDFLTDGYNSATGSLGFIAGGATSGEVFRADVHAQRETDLYSASFGFEFTDECFSLLLNGGIYWNATENLRLGAVFTYNPLFMFSAMAEQNIVPAATFAINLNDNSKLDIELGMLYKTDRFFELPSGNNRTHNLSMAFSIYYTFMFNNFSVFAGLTSHTLYSYLLFLQPRWVLGAEYTINDHLSASINAAVQYGDVMLSAYIDSFSMDISCKYRF
jgi:hypothetical protein